MKQVCESGRAVPATQNYYETAMLGMKPHIGSEPWSWPPVSSEQLFHHWPRLSLEHVFKLNTPRCNQDSNHEPQHIPESLN